MNELKDWVRQRVRPGASMARGYITTESMNYVADYARRLYKKVPSLWSEESNAKVEGIALPRCCKTETMKPHFREQVHQFLLLNAPCMEEWRERHFMQRRIDPSTPEILEWCLPSMTIARAENPRSVTQMQLDIAIGPGEKADFYSAS